MIFLARRDNVELEAAVQLLGEDWLVAVTGGDRPHIGAAAIGIPHQGMECTVSGKSTASVFNIPGHRDGMVAEYFAKQISGEVQRNVVAVCGIHFNEYSVEKKELVLELSKNLCKDIIMYMNNR